ncbi:MAG: winged helix-turn-helix domain-containing protein [Candidatus Micrarchaeia archaeon]
MEEEKIVLDRKSFEALAVDSRVRILKSLKERRKTLSEISKEQDMSVSGTKEHLETLEKVGLIEKIDDGHKWKYYKLTRKGHDIVAPRELRVWILLSISMIALAASMMAFLAPPSPLADDALAMKAAVPENAPAPSEPGGERMFAASAIAGNETTDAQASTAPDTTIPLVVAGISTITVLACVGILARNRMKPTSL